VTDDTCKVCGRSCAVGMQCAVKIGARWVMWRECKRCYFDAEARMQSVLEQAERSGV
jgi:hypothetical protein